MDKGEKVTSTILLSIETKRALSWANEFSCKLSQVGWQLSIGQVGLGEL